MSNATISTTPVAWTAEKAEAERVKAVETAERLELYFGLILKPDQTQALLRPVNPGCGAEYRMRVSLAVAELKKLIAEQSNEQKRRTLLTKRSELIEEAGSAYELIVTHGTLFDRMLTLPDRSVTPSQFVALEKALRHLRWGLLRIERDLTDPVSTAGSRKGPSAEQIKRKRARAERDRQASQLAGAGKKK